MNTPSGYSGTPLSKKLGIKSGMDIQMVNPPSDYEDFFKDFPMDVQINSSVSLYNLIHFFTDDKQELTSKLPQLKTQIHQNGMIWVSWPKKASKVPTDVTEDVIRKYALEIGLVDIKVCSVNEIWSALKLVIPVKDRI